MIWGVDLGGTKIEGVVCDPILGPDRVFARHRIKTDAHLGYEYILSRIAGLVTELVKRVGSEPKQIGIGTPGAVDPKSGQLKNSNTVCLNGRHFRSDITKVLGIPVEIANDANCFALTEAVHGAGRGSKVCFGTIMGTGVGGGIVVSGEVLSGLHGIAGEWGHNELEPDGDVCYCGRRGCVETVISGTGLTKYYERLSGFKRSLPEILDLARHNHDKHALSTLNRLTEGFGKAIAEIINVIDPDVVVLGGGVGQVPELLTDGVDAAKAHVFNTSLATAFRLPLHGDSAGVFGAALLVR